LPLVEDLPYRVFDALLAGQIPLVPDCVRDLDLVIPPADQARLPIVRFSDFSVAAVRSALDQALAAFDRGGETAALARHEFVRDRHMVEDRLSALIRHCCADPGRA
jgi:hypothetical protein